MKKTIKLLMASCCTLMACNVLASDGTLEIKGKIVGSSCTITTGGGSTKDVVTMPGVSINALAAEGAVAAKTPFYFELSGCPVNVAIQAYFESSNIDSNTGYLSNKAAAPAGNVEVQVLNRDGDVIDLRTNSNNLVYQDNITDDSGSATLRYFSQYVAVGGAATAGDVYSQLVYTLVYP